MANRLILCALLLLLGSCGLRQPPEVRLAVDAGFQPAVEALREAFEAECGCRLRITAGASGLLYGQIRAGEPFDMFLSADTARPVLLEKAGLTVPASRQTYARGQLALWVSREISTDKSSGYSTLTARLARTDTALTPRQLILLLGRGKHKVVASLSCGSCCARPLRKPSDFTPSFTTTASRR